MVDELPIRIVNSYQEEIKKAKQMEKKQIIEFASSYGYAISANGHNQDIIEEFYNQEYGK